MWGLGRAAAQSFLRQCSREQPGPAQGALTLSEDSAAIATRPLPLLLLSEQDLRGSDLENMSLSKRFLQEGERGGVSRAQEGALGDQGLLRPEAAYVCLAHCSSQGEQEGPRLSCPRVWLPTTHLTFHTRWRPGSLSPSLLGHVALCPLSWPGLEAPVTASLSLNK